ncbi:MAG: SCP2 sterol-binding domain-containing protein, partial [Ktedonobacterales bacterium]
DAPPWYVEPAADRVYACQGRADAPVLTLRCSVDDWARIAGDKLNPTLALVTRKLKLSGESKLMLRLPAILGS